MNRHFLTQQKIQPKTATHKKRTPDNMKIDSFGSYFEDVMARKNNQYALIESPHLEQRLSDISATFNDHYLSAISTPATKVLKRIERKKYVDLKQKISKAIGEFEQSKVTSLKQFFEYKQLLLNEFLNQFTAQIEKECRQKGEILKYIWNSMFAMIEHIADQLSKNQRQQEQQAVKHDLEQHHTYQQLLENYKEKHSTLAEKYNVQKVTIHQLVYELRFKRKEISKLQKNQKMLLNKLNQIKNDNLNLQSSYIDLICQIRDMPADRAQQMLKAREEIDRHKHIRIKIKGNKKAQKAEISQQLSNDHSQELNQLLEQIKGIANSKMHPPHIIGTLIDAAIENFGITHDDCKLQEQSLQEVAHRLSTVDAETQITENAFKNPNKTDQMVQFSFLDKLTENMINNKVTQTYYDIGKKKILISKCVGIDSQQSRKKYVDWHFRTVRVFQESILLQKQQIPKIIMTPAKFERNHKKHQSQLNFIRLQLPRKTEKNTEEFNREDDLIQNEFQDEDSKEFGIFQESGQKENREQREKGKGNERKREKKVRKVTNTSQTFSYLHKRSTLRKNSRDSGPKQELQNQKSSQHTAPASRFKQRPTVQDEGPAVNTLPQFTRSKEPRRTTMSPLNQYSKLRSDFARTHFLSANNCFNLVIDEKKQTEINNFFMKKDTGKPQNMFFDLEEQELEESDNDLDNEVIAATLNHIDNLPVRQISRNNTLNSPRKSQQKRVSMQMLSQDQNDLLINVCRNKYYKKSRKIREKKEPTVLKFKDEFSCVKDNIQMIARDVQQLIKHKEELLKKVINSKNIKNIYKILMMTFAKAYDCYNKGVIITNLVYPLFESFSLIYGAINNAEVYKKMINFIAWISVKTDNTILRFFLFFLGLDRSSPHSAHVTISEVYLCLALLQKISIEGKVTLNIESIYTDMVRIKQQLSAVLQQQKIPSQLCANIKKRVDEQLQNSATLRNSGDSETHFKINIYNIILMIIQELIKSKYKLMEIFIPIFKHCPEYEQCKKVPVALLETILSLPHYQKQQKSTVNALLDNLKTTVKTLSCEQFCSILFEHNVISLDQLLEQNNLVSYRWRIPGDFTSMMLGHLKRAGSRSQDRFQLQLFSNLVQNESDKNSEEYASIETMKKLIFIKYYFRIADKAIECILGDYLGCFCGAAEQ